MEVLNIALFLYDNVYVMPSFRIDKKASGHYLSVVESFRDEQGKPRTKTLANVGKIENFNASTIQSACKRLYALCGGNPLDLETRQTKELSRHNFGYEQMVDHLMQHFGIHHICRRITKKHKLSFEIESVLSLMLIERLNDPCSKLASYQHRVEYLNLSTIELQWMYRTLDKLDQYSDLIQDQVYLKGRNLFNQKLDIVFYDVTTFYFDSEVEVQGGLRQKGFSKDGKIGKTQIVFGMLIDKNKQPVGYQIFDGNTFEGHTLQVALEGLMKKYTLDKVIVVADRAMLSSANIEWVTQQLGMKYIFGERLKAMPKSAQDIFLDKSQYTQRWTYDSCEQKVHISYYSCVYNDRRVISTYSEKRAKKDKHDREKKLEKAKAFLKHPSKLNTKANYHYITTKSENTYVLNDKKIQRDELFDGILAISTNDHDLTDIEILDQYRHLFQIEHSFRTMKSVLEVRPMFHWTDKRIRGHICMCYLSLAMLRNVQLRLQMNGHEWSENQIVNTLDQMQVSIIEQDNQIFYLRSKITDEQETLTQTFKLKPVKPLTHKALIIK